MADILTGYKSNEYSGSGKIAHKFVDNGDGTFSEQVALGAGTIELGEVSIDQDVPGTTNAVSLAQIGATTVATGTGAQSAGSQRVTVAVDSATVAGSASLPAGTNAIGKLAANSGVDIGDVDVISSALPTGAATSANQTTEIASLANLNNFGAGEYETVAASQTDQMLGPTGAIGDYLAGLLIIPATTSPGGVSIEDGATNIPVFVGGASSVSNLIPFFVPLGIKSVSGGWEITTGADVSVIGIGNFT